MGKKAVEKKTWKRGRTTSTLVTERKQFLTLISPDVISAIKEAPSTLDGPPRKSWSKQPSNG